MSAASPKADPAHMDRAIALAAHPPWRTSPNPTVGCVVVKDGAVIGEGVTRPAGQAHAEVVALEAAGEAARGADMYVTLEPCSHFGRTPPCTDAILAAGIRRVFVGVIDPNPLVHGEGLRKLEAAGVAVEVGLLGARCARQLAPFRRFILDRRPWVMLKAAVTLDGRIAAAGGDSKWITGEAARVDVHRLRARADAVLVGAGTARTDDPRLTVRHGPDAERAGVDPLRVVLDTDASLPPDAAMLGEGCLVCHGPMAEDKRVAALAATGAELLELPLGRSGLELDALMSALRERGVVRLMVEGGGVLHGALLGARLADEACIYVAPRFVGRGVPLLDLPSAATIAAGWRIDPVDVRAFGPDVRLRGPIVYPAIEADGPER